MRSTMMLLAILVVMITLLIGCKSNTVDSEPLQPITLKQLYPGDIQNVDQIDIRSGSTGELKSYTNQKMIHAWIDAVSELELQPDPNQEGRTGFQYSVTLYEHKESKLSFLTNSIHGHYYLDNKAFTDLIKQLFESTPQ
ncbi:hypothetical protein [Paenibacillus hexagrammi]|uniref:Lipoprotein n=1 Tax=Paenibacillus hexagrammi TaxID=2908839 RepID=A0ABY3SNT3_9BACL|nr:hypothetical protein [Paenibacillus sp. YPD9-1]UJF35128.1 hypothetical protein L0M14_08350 [Paenibacillus sp. YPD9-1]